MTQQEANVASNKTLTTRRTFMF